MVCLRNGQLRGKVEGDLMVNRAALFSEMYTYRRKMVQIWECSCLYHLASRCCCVLDNCVASKNDLSEVKEYWSWATRFHYVYMDLKLFWEKLICKRAKVWYVLGDVTRKVQLSINGVRASPFESYNGPIGACSGWLCGVLRLLMSSSGTAQALLRPWSSCTHNVYSLSVQVTAAAAHIQKLKRNQRKKNSSITER